MDTTKVAIFGHGTIGGGVSRILLRDCERIAQKTGANLVLAAICTIDADLDPEIYDNYRELFIEAERVFADPSITIICETIGGDGIAFTFVKKALESGKSVVTANKKLIALHFQELAELAQKTGGHLLFEAAVGGGIPLLSTIKDGLAGDAVTEIEGILNGTTNYILTKMDAEGADFDQALCEAQTLGYAEADPTDDVEGFDTAYKLSILSALAFGKHIMPSAIPRTGISGLTKEDLQYARRLGGKIKLLASATDGANELCAQVSPVLILGGSRIAKTDGVLNAVNIIGTYNTVGNFLSGEGAGRFATAAAIISDMVQIALGRASRIGKIISTEAISVPKQAYFLRFRVHDRPGILGEICSIFGTHGISIDAVEQVGHQHDDTTHFVLTTLPIASTLFQQALAEIAQLPFNAEPPFVIPMRG